MEMCRSLHNDSASLDEAGYAGNGKSLQLLASIGIHISVARFYAHDSSSREIAGLDRQRRVEGRATEVETLCGENTTVLGS